MHLDFLRALYEDPPGEFGTRYVSVYLDTTPTTAGAATEVALRWRAARERLAAAGVEAATLDAVGQAATRRDDAVRGRVIFARDGAVRLEGALPRPPQQELANLAPLPHVMPWLAQLPARVPHVRVAAGSAAVTVDREVAADDAAFDAEARAEEERHRELEERALLDELAARLGGAAPAERRAVSGLADTLTALRDGLVSDVLLIGEPSWVPEAVWIGPGLADAATARAALVERGIDAPIQGRADAALARAATGTGAELHFVSADRSRPGDAASGAVDGIAALLRAPR
jgi:hypothetical protein